MTPSTGTKTWVEATIKTSTTTKISQLHSLSSWVELEVVLTMQIMKDKMKIPMESDKAYSQETPRKSQTM